MAKKKKTQPKDDLIDQLLGDVNDIAADGSLDDLPLDGDAFFDSPPPPENTGSGDAPIGLAPEENRATEIFGGAPPALDLNEIPHSSQEPYSPPSFDGVPLGGADDDPMNFPFASKGRGEEVPYQGPSADGGYQSFDELAGNFDGPFESAEGHEHEATRAIASTDSANEKTEAGGGGGQGTATLNSEATVAADGFAHRKTLRQEPQEKVVIGALRGARGGNVLTTMDASLAQAENLKLAQQKILDLEKENDRLRQENDEVSSAADIIRSRLEEMTARITSLEREKSDIQEAGQNEIMILKGNLQFKESEVAKARLRIDELETRLKNDFKKIRVKERELENRLELARAEKAALIRAKDENILELKRKIDQLQSEIDNYREKFLELNRTLGSQQEQFKRTVRALRLALANLEAKDENIVPLKKAE